MLLNKNEFFLMNNPVRAFIQSKFEIKKLRQISMLGKDKKVLEIGCGNGFGTTLIRKHFAPVHLTAIDLDEKMIDLAIKKYSNFDVEFLKADVSRLPFPDNSFDAVFDFGILHHIPNWKQALNEIYRVLNKKGELIMEDGSINSFSTPIGRIFRKILDHPYKKMYLEDEFVNFLLKIEFKHIKIKKMYPFGIMPFFVLNATK